MYNIEEMFENADQMLNQSMDLIMDSIADISRDQRNVITEFQSNYEQLLKLINTEESI